MPFFGISPSVQLANIFGSATSGPGWYELPWGAVRTVRPNMTTVFFVIGYNDPTRIPLTLETAFLRLGDRRHGFNLTRAIDINHAEFVFLVFTELLTNMAPGHAAAKASLTAQINKLAPGQNFILIGFSEGAAVVSDVYDEIRTGTLTSRRPDLIGGWTCGNPRREAGHTFVDPNFGAYPDPCVDCAGISNSRLVGTEQLWWDMAVADDPVTCVSLTSDKGWWMRRLYDEVHKLPSGTTLQNLLTLVKTPDPHADGMAAATTLLGIATSGHEHYDDRPPFPPDTRSFIQTGVDYVNMLATDPTPPGTLHRLVGQLKPTTPRRGGVAPPFGAQAMWWNLPTFNGPAISASLEVFDSAGTLLTTLKPATAIINNPPHNSNWRFQQFQGAFQRYPATAATSRLVLEVAPEVMTTGIVWFKLPKQ